MALDGEPPKSVDKGKGKAVDGEPSKVEEVKKDKDGKPLVNGKKDDEIIGGKLRALEHEMSSSRQTAPEELSEEDQQLKNELEMLVERLTVWNLWERFLAYANKIGFRNQMRPFTNQPLKPSRIPSKPLPLP